jgi:adenylate kinase
MSDGYFGTKACEQRLLPEMRKIYNLINKKPLNENVCDVCKVDLVQRADDNEETALLRFKTYEEETKPLLRYFKDKGILKEINANLPIDEVWEQIIEITG